MEWFDLEQMEQRRAEIIPSDYAFIDRIFRKGQTGVFRATVAVDEGYRLVTFKAEP